MASSDDEAEALPHAVSDYDFVDDKSEPISFHVLPIQWSECRRQEGKKAQIFLHGKSDNGLQTIYKKVIAWKFDLSNRNPEISVLSKENNWIKLQKPRKSFEDIIRSILITLHYLHYLKRNPEASSKSLWDHLSKVFSLYEVRPSQNDLVDHLPLISEASKCDDALANSKLLLNSFKEKPTKRKLPDEDIQATTKPGFLVDDKEDYVIDDDMEDYVIDDDMEDYAIDDEDESNEDDNLFDSVCAFCDNGGQLLCCEGRCLRSFHATVEDGCESLGFTRDEVKAMQKFFCKNCEYKQHQCCACGKLGSSDRSSGAEVFPCVSATCGQFYHPRCIAKLIYHDNGVSAEELEKKIAMGESFTCPIHKCCVCKQGENKKDPQLRFAVCRRCPKSYHRKCLPREIVFEKTEEDVEEEDIEDENIVARAWEGLLPNRILIYCMKHEIDEKIGTPIRDHVKFPDVEEKKTTVGKKKASFEEKKRKRVSDSLVDREKFAAKKRNLSSEELYRGKVAPAISKQKLKSSAAKVIGSRSSGKVPSGLDISGKAKGHSVLKKKVKTSLAEENKTSLGEKLYTYRNESEQVKSGKQGTPDGELKSGIVKPASKMLSSAPTPPLDAATERRLLALMKDATSSLTMEDVIQKHKASSTHASSRNAVDRNITLGKVEGSIEAVRTALWKLEEGCITEDAEAVCAPEILNQIYKWKNKLKVYLAPFLHGMRYTSFGRHFTKVEKLEQIADRLHWYVEEGDMVVDFCCGANDFSIIMKKKLEETGKKCFYRNYDIIQAKNDFNFEQRDWMTVQPKELPNGKRLIMGLNPPFGVKAALANKFIDKALEFSPKILILIVPQETQRLNEKKSPYDLIWEDAQLLSGKSFYLPGSVDENDKQMDQWNVNTPPLYLWSRPDFSAKHKSIAQNHGHISTLQGSMEESNSQSLIHDGSVGDKDHYGETSMLMDDHPVQIDGPEDLVGGAMVTKGHKESFSKRNGDRGCHETLDHRKNHVNEKSGRLQKPKQGRGSVEISPDNKLGGGWVSATEMHKDMLPRDECGEKGHEHSEPSNSGSSMQLGTPDDTGRSFNLSRDEPYLSVAHRWSSGASPGSGYGATNLEDPFMGRMRERSDSLGRRPYSIEIEEQTRRESDIRSQVRLYGPQNPELLRSNYLTHRDSVHGQIGSFSSTYGHGPLTSELSYRMNTSAMERYAPRLDEMNRARISALGLDMSRTGSSSGYEPHRFSSSSFFDPRVPRPVYPPGGAGGPTGFASGPYQSYSNQNSAGWLNE